MEGSAGTRFAEVRSLVSGIVEFAWGAANRVAVRDERAQHSQLANLQAIRVKLRQRVGAGEVAGAAAKAYCCRFPRSLAVAFPRCVAGAGR